MTPKQTEPDVFVQLANDYFDSDEQLLNVWLKERFGPLVKLAELFGDGVDVSAPDFRAALANMREGL